MIGRAVAHLKGDGYVGQLARHDPDEIVEFSSVDRDMFDFLSSSSHINLENVDSLEHVYEKTFPSFSAPKEQTFYLFLRDMPHTGPMSGELHQKCLEKLKNSRKILNWFIKPMSLIKE